MPSLTAAAKRRLLIDLPTSEDEAQWIEEEDDDDLEYIAFDGSLAPDSAYASQSRSGAMSSENGDDEMQSDTAGVCESDQGEIAPFSHRQGGTNGRSRFVAEDLGVVHDEEAEERREALADMLGVELDSDMEDHASRADPSITGAGGNESEAIGLNEMEEAEEFEQRRLANRKQAIKYLESLPLTLMSELVTSLSIENNKLRSLALGPDGVGRTAVDQDDPTDAETEAHGEWGLSLPLVDRATGNTRYIKFPKKGVKTCAAKNLACLLRVADIMHEALLQDITVTKRDIYYKDVDLFKKQSVVDELVDTLVASASLRRADFNVCATAKGLVSACGIALVLRSGDKLTLSADHGTLIPPGQHIVKLVGSSPRWVLVVEKDESIVFQTLTSTSFCENNALGSGMIVTGKGYPDLATLQFLRLITLHFPECPILVLVDADPSGLDILSVYVNGSRRARNAPDSEGLALGDKVHWLGLKASEWQKLGVRPEDLLPLSDKDNSFAQSMLRNRTDLPEDWKRQLCHMLHLRRKAEIQILCQQTSTISMGLEANNVGVESAPSQDGPPDMQRSKATNSLVRYLENRMKAELFVVH